MPRRRRALRVGRRALAATPQPVCTLATYATASALTETTAHPGLPR
ncbi:hypothetical protein ABZ942_01150 [Nocardia sp. NPDC046473]